VWPTVVLADASGSIAGTRRVRQSRGCSKRDAPVPLTSAMMTMDKEKSAHRRCMGVFAAGRAMPHVGTMAVARPRVGASIGLKTGTALHLHTFYRLLTPQRHAINVAMI